MQTPGPGSPPNENCAAGPGRAQVVDVIQQFVTFVLTQPGQNRNDASAAVLMLRTLWDLNKDTGRLRPGGRGGGSARKGCARHVPEALAVDASLGMRRPSRLETPQVVGNMSKPH